MPNDSEVYDPKHVLNPETSSIGTSEPNEQLVDDVFRDDRTAPSTPPQRSPKRGCSPRPLGLTSPQTWPQVFREATDPTERKEEIDEPSASLMKDGHKQDERNLRSDTPSLGVRDVTAANSFLLTPGARRSATLQHAPSVVSDAGNQQWKDLKALVQRQVPQASESQTKDSTTARQFPESTQEAPKLPPRFQLQAQLRAAYQQIGNPMSAGPPKYFLPKTQLHALINPESVARELAERGGLGEPDATVRKVADAVCKEKTVELPGGKIKTRSYRPVFAILVLIEQSCSIELFMNDRVSDLDLPLVEHEDPRFHSHGDNGLYRANKKGEPQGDPLRCCKNWSPERRRQFCEYQWKLLSPFFYRSAYNNVNHYILKDQHLLPFVKCGSSLSRTAGVAVNDIDQRQKVYGGFSEVFFVHIHSEHHEFHGFDLDADLGFAVKQLKDEGHQTDEKFKKEVDMLKKFTGDGAHPHVVSVLATYEQFGKFHLIFHRANGDLFNYWKSICPPPVLDYATVVWVAKQLAGLAEGLLRFHRHYTSPKTSEGGSSSGEKTANDQLKGGVDLHIPARTNGVRFQDDQSPKTGNRQVRLYRENSETRYGRHGDLKPENILWFPARDDEKGVLKITDFGQAELHSESSKTYRQSRGIDTLTYRPPEGEIQPLMMRQSSDIWSLGCIYLEFVTWVFDGAAGVQAFKTSRLSYDSSLRMKSDTFFECVSVEGFQHKGAHLKHSVSKHIEDLASHANCSEYFKDVLELIRDMLVIEPSDAYAPPNRRKSCGELRLDRVFTRSLLGREHPFGSTYVAAHGLGVRAGIAEIAPKLIGMDPRRVDRINDAMDEALVGHLHAKTPIDVACWDIFGKSVGLPVCELLGGRTDVKLPLISSIFVGEPEEMRARVEAHRKKGYVGHSVKISGDDPVADAARIATSLADRQPGEFFLVDANAGLTVEIALRMLRLLPAGLDFVLEAPCATARECRSLRKRTDVPIIYDELATDEASVVDLIANDAAEGIGYKISKNGGLTRGRRQRDICLAAGYTFSVQETTGSDVAFAAIVHLAQTVPERNLRCILGSPDMVTVKTADGDFKTVNGRVTAPTAPGLGITPRLEVLGKPVASYA